LSEEEWAHAEKFMKLQNKLKEEHPSGHQKPTKDEWGNGIDVMQAALELEKAVNNGTS